jgi:hypothetical protein
MQFLMPAEPANHSTLFTFYPSQLIHMAKLYDFVRFLWMLADSAMTYSRFLSHHSRIPPICLAAKVGSLFSRRNRVRIGATIVKAAARRWPPSSCFLEQANSLETFHYLRPPSVP